MDKKTLIEKIHAQAAPQEKIQAAPELASNSAASSSAAKPNFFSNLMKRFKKEESVTPEVAPVETEPPVEELDLSSVFTDDEVDFSSATSFEDSIIEAPQTITQAPLSEEDSEALNYLTNDDFSAEEDPSSTPFDLDSMVDLDASETMQTNSDFDETFKLDNTETDELKGLTLVPGPSNARVTQKRTSIHSELVRLLSIILLVVFAVTATVSIIFIRANLKNEIVKRATALSGSMDPSLIHTSDITLFSANMNRFLEVADTSVVEDVLFLYSEDGNGKAHLRSNGAENISAVLHFRDNIDISKATEGKTFQFAFRDSETNQRYNVLAVTSTKLGDLGKTLIAVNLAPVNAQILRLSLILLGIFTVLGLITLRLSTHFSRSIVSPLQSLATIAQGMSKGDLSQLAPVTTNDEIGTLGKTLNQSILLLRGMVQSQEERENIDNERQELQDNIANFLEVVMDIADGDFSKRGEVSNDVLGNVVDAVNLMVDELSILLTQVQDSAISVKESSSVMANTSTAISRSSEEQTEKAIQARQQLQTLVVAIQEMAKRANASAKAALLTLNASQKGQEAVNNTLDGINEIRADVKSVSEQMNSLNKRSEEISEVVDSVTHISSQINLLALRKLVHVLQPLLMKCRNLRMNQLNQLTAWLILLKIFSLKLKTLTLG